MTMADADATPVSPVGASKPEISVSAPAINNEPVELDSTPTSPEELRKRRGSKEEVLTAEEREVRALRLPWVAWVECANGMVEEGAAY